MTDHLESLDDPSDAELAELTVLLRRADAWEDPPAGIEDAVVAAIAAEATTPASAPAVTTSLATYRRRRFRSMTGVLSAAAAVVVLAAGIVLITRGGDDGVAFALAGTEAAPDASAQVRMSATPSGLKIELETDGLPGAPDGFMYEAWVGDGEIAISTGTFHLRGGDAPIELWAGVTDPSFHRLWITLEPIDDDAAPSGDARLTGEFTLDED